MSSYDVTLSAATRQNLLSSADTAALTAINQNRLSTGKKVNSPLDNPLTISRQRLYLIARRLLMVCWTVFQTVFRPSKQRPKVLTQLRRLLSSCNRRLSRRRTNAATNLPKIQGDATSTETTATTAGKALLTLRKPPRLVKASMTAALAKTLFGTVGSATASSNGNIGLTAAGAGKTDVFRINAGNTTYDVQLSSTSTCQRSCQRH